MTPSITIAIPTIGRPSLARTLDSIARQRLGVDDRVLVMLDTYQEQPRPDIVNLVASYGPAFELHPFDGGVHFYGNPQLNEAMRIASTDYFCGLGDDDIYVDGAIERLKVSLRPGRATLCQFYSPPFDTRDGAFRFVLWDEPKLRVAHISGCCLIAPVSALVPVKADLRCEVDYEWIVDVVKRTGHRPVWMPDCLIIARPDVINGAYVHRGVSACGGCGLVQYLEQLDSDGLCGDCEHVVLREFLVAPV